MIAKHLVGRTGFIYAYEPLSENISIIKTQATINDMNIVVAEVAFSDKIGKIDFIVGTVIEKTRKYVSSIENRITIKTVSISDFIYKHGRGNCRCNKN